jgi:hypothetical protein
MQKSSATTEQITSWDSAAVSEFASGDADVLVLKRDSIENIETAIRASRVNDYAAPVCRETAGSAVRAGMNEAGLESSELESDIINLTNSFLDQFNIEEAKLRIEITETQSCPKFHCDNVNVRLVTTYLGSTTEYQFSGDSKIHSAPLFGLVFLKGHRNPTCGDTVLHRSPEMPNGERRLCVAIDF